MVYFIELNVRPKTKELFKKNIYNHILATFN